MLTTHLKKLIKIKKAIFIKDADWAYYEVLDTIKNELIAHNQNLKEFGLDENLELKMLS